MTQKRSYASSDTTCNVHEKHTPTNARDRYLRGSCSRDAGPRCCRCTPRSGTSRCTTGPDCFGTRSERCRARPEDRPPCASTRRPSCRRRVGVSRPGSRWRWPGGAANETGQSTHAMEFEENLSNGEASVKVCVGIRIGSFFKSNRLAT